jgi:hypothetical protein
VALEGKENGSSSDNDGCNDEFEGVELESFGIELSELRS